MNNLLRKPRFLAAVIAIPPFLSTALAFHGPFSSTGKHSNTSIRTSPSRPFASTPPLQSVFSNLASSLMPSSPNPKLDSTLSSIGPSWDTIRSDLVTLQTPLERSFRENVEFGYGEPSPLHKIRLFDPSNSESSIRVTFYRDSASWCPYCQKVWLMLEEKKIPYKVVKVNMRCYGEKPDSFRRVQPNGNIPVAEIDGVIYNQSNDIMMALENLFPDTKSCGPNNEEERVRARSLLSLERKLFGAWMYWLTGSARSKNEFLRVLEEVEGVLKENERLSDNLGFFLGDRPTLVDFMFASFLERMAASLLYFKGFQMRFSKGVQNPYPRINKWFDAMETLDSYRLTKSDYYTHCWDLPPQLGGCTREKGAEIYERAINGEASKDGGVSSWELPLVKDNGGLEPDWEWCNDDATATREAVERLSFNHDNIVNFAARGAGNRGSRYGAPLADPNATPNTNVIASVDAVLRCVATAMLNGVDNDKETKSYQEVVSTLKELGTKKHVDEVVQSIQYLRDRIGVPRDMRLPAARQFRAHLNWALNQIKD